MRYRRIQDVALLVEAFLLLHISKLIILLVPFKKIASKLGELNIGPEEHIADLNKVKTIHVAIQRAIKISIHSSKCYDQALTARWMLGRRGIGTTLFFGLSNEADRLSAHAWVKSGQFTVTGKAGMDKFTVVAAYTHQV